MYIIFIFTELMTTITLRMMKSVIQSGYKTVQCFLSITYSHEKATNTQHTTTVINTGEGHFTVGEGHCVRSERCRLRWQDFLPPCFGALAVFMLLLVALKISLSANAWNDFFMWAFLCVSVLPKKASLGMKIFLNNSDSSKLPKPSPYESLCTGHSLLLQG